MQGKKQILIAHSNETVCKGLGTIVREEVEHSEVCEVTTSEELQAQMEQCHFDLIMLHQSFLTCKVTLPTGRFVLLATEPTIEVFMFACLHGALAYVMENTSRSLLHQIMHFVPGAFISDTVVRHCLSEYIAHHLIFSISEEFLTAREREVFRLLCNGLTKSEVAERLAITESTLRTHRNNIREKFQMNRYQAQILALLLPGLAEE